MARLEEGQSVEFWWGKAEFYRKKLRREKEAKERRIAELEHALRDGYSIVTGSFPSSPNGRVEPEEWCSRVERLMVKANVS